MFIVKLKRSLVFVALLLLLYSILRGLFLVFNWQAFSDLESSIILSGFLIGPRYDLAAVLMANGALILVYLFPIAAVWQTSWLRKGCWIFFGAANILLLAFQIADLEYFQFRGKRLSPESFLIIGDFPATLGSSIGDYAWLWLLLLVSGFIVIKAMTTLLVPVQLPLAKGGGIHPLHKITPWVLFLVVAGLVATGVRGGTQPKPLIPANAFQGNTLGAQLTLNSAFTVLRSPHEGLLRPLDYFKDWNEVWQILGQAPLSRDGLDLPWSTPPNMIVIIVESLGREYMGNSKNPAGFTPFISSLATKGHAFHHSFANGRKSVEVMTSLFAGIPNLMKYPLIVSPYGNNAIEGLPRILGRHGYQTAFFHGGNDGTMFFDLQSKLVGFDNYWGATAFKKAKESQNLDWQSYHDGHWGIFDEPFLEFTGDVLSGMTEPFFAGVFTLSSHYPYQVPTQYEGRFSKGTLPIHESMGYSDFALERFFARNQNAPWFKNTLFVLTGDHTSLSEDKTYQSATGVFRVPMIFYYPNGRLPLDGSRIAQHIDLQPTIAHWLNLEHEPQPRFGKSLSASDQSLALLFDDVSILGVRESTLIRELAYERFAIYDWKQDPKLKKPLNKSLIQPHFKKTFQAKLQYYRNGLLENRINW